MISFRVIDKKLRILSVPFLGAHAYSRACLRHVLSDRTELTSPLTTPLSESMPAINRRPANYPKKGSLSVCLAQLRGNYPHELFFQNWVLEITSGAFTSIFALILKKSLSMRQLADKTGFFSPVDLTWD